jgi:hypothetical protein
MQINCGAHVLLAFKAVRRLSLCASIFTIAGNAYLDEEQYLMKLDAPVMIIIMHPDKFSIVLSFDSNDSTKQLKYEYAHTEPFDLLDLLFMLC